MVQRYKPKSKEELRQIAEDIVSDKIFTNLHVTGEEKYRQIKSVFLPIIFTSSDQLRSWDIDEITMIYEYMRKSIPSKIKGSYPTFFSMNILDNRDTNKVLEHVAEIRDKS